MRQHAGSGSAARRRHCGGRGLDDRIARLAGVLRPDMADHQEAARHIVQHLGDILAEPGHAGTALGAGAGAVIPGLMHNLLTRQMLGQRSALGLRALDARGRAVLDRHLGLFLRRAGLQFLELQLQLFDPPGDPLRRPAELHPPQLGDLELQLLDLQRGELDREFGRFQFRTRRRQLDLTGERKSA